MSDRLEITKDQIIECFLIGYDAPLNIKVYPQPIGETNHYAATSDIFLDQRLSTLDENFNQIAGFGQMARKCRERVGGTGAAPDFMIKMQTAFIKMVEIDGVCLVGRFFYGDLITIRWNFWAHKA